MRPNFYAYSCEARDGVQAMFNNASEGDISSMSPIDGNVSGF